MLLIKIFLSSILLFNTLDDTQIDKSIFISPVRIPLALSANFGELRIDHFHSGLDIKTQGVTGKEVVAAADGYVYRIGVSASGFGNAIYLKHPSGYSTVYAHLNRFIPEIEEYVKEYQYEKKSYQVTIFLPAGKFSVKQGELIAYSGNSGGSAGPHLHYEIRKSVSEMPVNPLLFEFGIDDNIAPVIDRLVIYPLSRNTLINNQNLMKKIAVAGNHGSYYISSDDEIRISGPAGFGIKSYDLLNDSYNKCAVYSIELKIDSITKFKYLMDGFSFNESRYINSHIDYESYLRENTYIERTFVLPNDKLSVYSDLINRGIFNFSDNKTHHIEIIVTDIHANKSSLDFNVRGQISPPIPVSVQTEENKIVMPYGRANKYRAENITVSFPAGSLYDTLFFTYRKDFGTPKMFSEVHYVHNKYTPLQKAYTLSIKPRAVPSGKESKMLIVNLSDDFQKSALESTLADGYVSAEALSFGMFYVDIDTIAPSIFTNGLVSGADLTGRNELRIRINDDLSGIKGYEPLIDGKWALFEFDQKNNVLIYKFDSKRIMKGTKHLFTLKVSDNKDNLSLFSCDFIW
jgi:hypothetical protein